MRRAALLVVLVLAVLAAPAALADGDPASDFLLSQQYFLSPYDCHLGGADQNRVNAMLASSKQQGFPLKLAVIYSKYDLGAVPILFGKPQLYAKFLAEEDFFIWKSELLVVMPNGYGIYRAKGTPPADKALIAKLPPLKTTDCTALVQAAEGAVNALAKRRGIVLATSSASSGGGSSVWTERGEIAGGVVALGLLAFAGQWVWRRRRT